MKKRICQLFEMDSVFNTRVGQLADLIFLNLIVFFFSIPLITVGTSYMAMDAVLLKMCMGEEYHIWKDFIAAFKQNMRKTVKVWILWVLIEIFLFWDIWICIENQFAGDFVITGLAGVAIVIGIVFLFYYNILATQEKECIITTARHAGMIMVLGTWRFPVILLIHIFPLLLLWITPEMFVRLIFVWIMGGTALLQLIGIRIYCSLLIKIHIKADADTMVTDKGDGHL